MGRRGEVDGDDWRLGSFGDTGHERVGVGNGGELAAGTTTAPRAGKWLCLLGGCCLEEWLRPGCCDGVFEAVKGTEQGHGLNACGSDLGTFD
ncbi:hypothetical protein M0R45_030817 [Rubus argutus]|uniref:Uncharacterized protein n=1 Tax=Rubus argutus TaxID=59490 RepID=A0AAW1WGG6_RUBAR